MLKYFCNIRESEREDFDEFLPDDDDEIIDVIAKDCLYIFIYTCCVCCCRVPEKINLDLLKIVNTSFDDSL